MDTEQLVSVVIPTYNREKKIIRAINSVLRQTHKNLEVIVVDDYSSDNTKQHIKDLKDNRIKYYRLPKKGNGAIARNHGIMQSTGRYIAFLDSDDEWYPDKIKKQLELYKNGFRGICYCKHIVKFEESNTAQTISSSHLKRGNLESDFLSGWCPAIMSSAMMLKELLLDKHLLFDENLTSYQDYDFWLQISQYYLFEYVEEVLVKIYIHNTEQVSINISNRMLALEYLLEKWTVKFIENNTLKTVRKRLIKNILETYIIKKTAFFSTPLKKIIRLQKESTLSISFSFKILTFFLLGRNVGYKLLRVFSNKLSN